MPLDLLALYAKLPVFLMVTARLAGMVMFQPILGALAFPATLRALLVLGLAALATPLVPFAGPLPDTLLGLTLALGGEMLLGGLIGLVATLVFVGVQMGGTLVDQETGLAFGQIVDPTTGQNLSLLSNFYVQLCAVVYLTVGGHRTLLCACLDTFRTVPLLGGSDLPARGTDLLVAGLTTGCDVAVRVAAPALLTLFLVNVALGFIARTMPQLNVTTVGFAVKGLIAFVVLALALPTALAAFTDGLEATFDSLQELLGH